MDVLNPGLGNEAEPSPSMLTETSLSPEKAAGASRGRWPIHPFLIGAYPVLSLYAQNVYEVRLGEVYRPLGLSMAITAGLWLAAWAIIRERVRAALVTSLAVAVFWTSTQVTPMVNDALTGLTRFWVFYQVELPVGLVVAVEVVLALVASYRLATRFRRASGLTAFLNVFSLALIVLPIVQITRAWSMESSQVIHPASPIALSPRPGPGGKPDIYYIILDGFARGDVLKDLFDYDLEPFLGRLEQRGFYVARQSTSNYGQTPLSLASSMNAAYLEALVDLHEGSIGKVGPLIGDGAVVRALRSHGYKFVTYATGFPQTEHPGADLYRSPRPTISGFQRMLLDASPLIWLPNRLTSAPDTYARARERTLYLLDTLHEVARDSDPTFTFAHIVAPHPPFLFGPRGEDISPRHRPYFLNDGSVYLNYYGNHETYVSGYRGQVTYLVRRVEQVIAKILDESPVPPIIILQSDHGSGSRLDVESAEKTDMHERMSILNAYHFPGSDYRGLDPRITPVNSFRVVFNTCLGGRLEHLPDRSYFSTWPNPFHFIDVTDQVRAPDPAPKNDAKGPVRTPREG